MRRVLYLTIVAVAVWVLAVWLPGETPEKTEPGVPAPVGGENAADTGPWIDFSDGAVDRVVIHKPAGDVTLFKKDGEWFVTPPGGQTVRAERDKAEALTAFLRGHPPLRRLAVDGEDLAGYGVDNATRGISVFADGMEFSLTVGGMNPTGDGVYALADGPAPVAELQSSAGPMANEVLLLDTSYASRLAGGADTYFDLRALDMSRQALASIRLEGPDEGKRTNRWEISFDADNATQASFTWPEPLKGKAVSNMEADSYATRLLDLKGTRFFEPAAQAGIVEESVFDIYVRRRGNDTPERLAFSLYRPEDADPLDATNATFVLQSDWQTRPMVVAAKDVDAMLRTAFSLRDLSITHFAAHDVTRIEASYVEPGRGVRNATAERQDKVWMLDGPDGGHKLGELGMAVWKLADLRYTDEPRDVLPADARRFLVLRMFGAELDASGLQISWYELPYGVGTLVSLGGDDGPWYPVGESGQRLADELTGQLFEEGAAAGPEDAPENAANASATSP